MPHMAPYGMGAATAENGILPSQNGDSGSQNGDGGSRNGDGGSKISDGGIENGDCATLGVLRCAVKGASPTAGEGAQGATPALTRDMIRGEYARLAESVQAAGLGSSSGLLAYRPLGWGPAQG